MKMGSSVISKKVDLLRVVERGRERDRSKKDGGCRGFGCVVVGIYCL